MHVTHVITTSCSYRNELRVGLSEISRFLRFSAKPFIEKSAQLSTYKTCHIQCSVYCVINWETRITSSN